MPKIKILTCLFVLFQVMSIAFGQSYAIAGYNVTATSGTSSASYTSLKAAFDAINNGTHRGNIKILVTSNSTETNTAQINASGSGGANYTSVLLYPQSSGITISGSIGDKGLIYINGADRFSINGSVNADGFIADMTLQNTGGCVISFNNGASDNSIKYAKIKASGNSTALIKSPNDAAGFNDRDSIIGCHLTSVSTSQRPYTAFEIVWTGSSTYNGLTISNNRFYDLWNTNNTSYNLYILTDGTSNGIKITDNHFYETTSFLPGGNNSYYHIFLDNLNSNSNIISGNYFGGTTPECGGNALSIGNSTASSNKDVNYMPLYLNLGASTISQITDNQISNIQLKTASSDPFRAIYVFKGAVEISNNTIGSSTGNNNIYLTATNKKSTSYGIYVNQSENAIITNNAIGSITTTNTSNEGHGFYGIYKQTWDNGVLKINDNYIGSRDTPNSIQCLSPSSKNNTTQMVVGISAGSNSGAEVIGNIVGSLSNFSTNNRTDNSIYGIIVSANGYNLIDRNFVFGLTATFSGPSGIMAGIYVDKGHNTISNNVVYIGEGNSSGLFPIYGIADYNNEKVDGYYNYNTVYLAGTVTGTSTANTAAFYKANWGEHAHLTNNILVNMRSGGGTSSGENTALNIENTQMTSLVNSDYNDLYVNPNSPNSYLGSLGSQNYNDLSTWTTSTGSDDNSVNINPEFVAVGNDPTGFIPTADLNGAPLDGSDFGDSDRPDNPTMGAWELNDQPTATPAGNVQVHIGGVLRGVYPNVKAAFDKINTGFHTGSIIIKIVASTTETGRARLRSSGSGNANYTNIILHPTASGLSISGDLDNDMIFFDGSDNFTLDGRVNLSGSANLQIINNNASIYASTLGFYNTAQNNIVQYCNIKGATNATQKGVIAITYNENIVGSGNTNINITNSNISGISSSQRPVNLIYAKGTTGFTNTGINIAGNNIYNFFNPSKSSYGVRISTNTSDVTISNNSFYETSSMVQSSTGEVVYSPVYIDNTSGSGFSVNSNYIGGTSQSIGGSNLSIGSSSNYKNTVLMPIFIRASLSATTQVQGNNIGKINIYSSSPVPFSAVTLNHGSYNAGDQSSNTIGSNDNTKIINVYSNNANATSYGINATVYANGNISNSRIGSINIFSNVNTNIHNFSAIYISGSASDFDLNSNFINLISLSNTGGSSVVNGIYFQSGAGDVFNNLVNLGDNQALNTTIYGFRTASGAQLRFYHNTINLSGTLTSGSQSTYAFRNDGSASLNLRNNILVNSRTGGTGKHYIIYLQATSGLVINYNQYFKTTSNNFLGYFGSDKNSYASWVSASMQDVNSQCLSPVFLNSSSGDPNDFLPTNSIQGQTGLGILVDLIGNSRLSPPTVGAIEFTGLYWTGNIDSDWNKPANWQPQLVPTLTIPAIIPQRTNQPIIYNTINGFARSLNIYTNAILTIDAGGTLTVSESIENNNGSSGLVINSSIVGTGSLIHNANGIQATVKRYIPDTDTSWYFLSAPVNSQEIFNNSWTPAGSYGDGTGYDLYVWDEPSSCWVYNLNTTISPTWSSVHTGTTFIPGKGYLYSLQNENTTKEFIGSLNNGSISRQLTHSSSDVNLKGFNFLGNPYPSSIDWKEASGFSRSMLNLNSGGYDIWVWSQSANNYGVYNSSDPVDTGTNNVSRYISPMQGFFVYAESSGNFSFNNNARVHNGASNWLRSSGGSTSSITLKIAAQSGSSSDEVKFRFGCLDQTPGAYKLFSHLESSVGMYVPVNKDKYSTINISDINQVKNSRIGIKTGRREKFIITCNNNDSNHDKIYLEDKLTGNIHDLSTNQEYSFISEAGIFEDRFVLHFGEYVSGDFKNKIKIYRNSNIICVSLIEKMGDCSLKIYDIKGKVVEQRFLTEGRVEEILLPEKGVYIFSVNSDKVNYNSKVLY